MSRPLLTSICAVYVALFCFGPVARAQRPNPVLKHVFPAGARLGEPVELNLTGSDLAGLRTIRLRHPDIAVENVEKNKLTLTISTKARPGLYDLRAVCASGISSPMTFDIGNLAEEVETEPNNDVSAAQSMKLDTVMNGRITKGDVDQFWFDAHAGEIIVIDCLAERIGSMLRAMLEIYDEKGRRVAFSRGYYGADPMIPFFSPATGRYRVRLHDLVFAGSNEAVYRLKVHRKRQVAFHVPSVVAAEKRSVVEFFGWNFRPLNAPDTAITEDLKNLPFLIVRPVRLTLPEGPFIGALRSVEATGDWVSPELPLAASDPIVIDADKNHSPKSAQAIAIPCEIGGQLAQPGELDWYSFQAKRGEVIWFEGFGERIRSPVDLDISILDETASTELARFRDQPVNLGGTRFPTNHLDPAGRWVAPKDGTFLLLVRSVTSSIAKELRRVYRVSLKREVPDVRVVAVPRSDQPSGWNLAKGDRLVADLIAFRRRGMIGTVRVSAGELPHGIECPDVFLGPNVNRGQIVITASDQAAPVAFSLKLEASSDGVAPAPVMGTTVVRSGLPNGWARTTEEIPVSVVEKEIYESDVRVIASADELIPHDLYGKLKPRHAAGSVVDVRVQVDRKQPNHLADVELIAIELPELIRNQTATIPAGQTKGHVSFYLPPSLPVGKYSFVIQAKTTVPNRKDPKKIQTVTLYSKPVTIDVKKPAFRVALDSYNPTRIHRGETIQIKYTAKRMNGFISKIHTELAAPVKPNGLRVRGVTFVGQTESGTLQIIANDDAPIGRQPFLRLLAVGVVEDEAIYQGGCFLNLEIVE